MISSEPQESCVCSPDTEITHGHCYAQLSLHGFLEAGGGSELRSCAYNIMHFFYWLSRLSDHSFYKKLHYLHHVYMGIYFSTHMHVNMNFNIHVYLYT